METITIQEAAKFLCVTVGTLHQWCHRRTVPYYNIGGHKVVFDRNELVEWLKSKRVKTSAEMQKEAETMLRGKR